MYLSALKTCSDVTCENGGTCDGDDYSFTCLCTQDYTGEYCEKGGTLQQLLTSNLIFKCHIIASMHY